MSSQLSPGHNQGNAMDKLPTIDDTLPSLTAAQIELALAAFGMWAEREDIDEAWLERGRRHLWCVENDSLVPS